MEEWREYRLGDVCNTISDTYKGEAQYVVLINTSDVLEGKCMNHQKTPNKDLKGQFKKTFKKDDILYSEIRPANRRYAYIDFEPSDYIASTKLMVIRHNEKILPLYLFYILKSQEVVEILQMLAESRSGTFPQITFDEVANMKIKLPSIEQQNKILGVLKSFDDKIECNRRINDNLEQQAKTIFKSWLSNCQAEVTIGDLSLNITDYSKCNSPKVVLVNSSDVTNGFFDHDILSDNMNLKGHFKKRFKKGDILYSQVRPRNRHWAYCTFEADHYLASTQLMVIRNKKEILPSVLLYQYLIEDDVWNEFTLKTETRSGTFPQGNYEDLASIRVPFGAEMNNIIPELESLYSLKYSIEKESHLLSSLRDTLLPELMSGKLKLNKLTV